MDERVRSRDPSGAIPGGLRVVTMLCLLWVAASCKTTDVPPLRDEADRRSLSEEEQFLWS
jgi:hypothetical protein